MTVLAERIHEILTSDDYIVVRDHLLGDEFLSSIKEKAHPEDLPLESAEYGFTVGLAFALTQPEPLEPLWSVSARAHELVEEVHELREKRHKEFRLRMAAQQGQRLAEQKAG